MKQVVIALIIAVLFLCFVFLIGWWLDRGMGPAHAMEVQEVKPYVFAELPHGRIYKTVHEGCELYIVESDIPTVSNQPGLSFHHYSLSTGRGCQ
jgi:hypothetical protein